MELAIESTSIKHGDMICNEMECMVVYEGKKDPTNSDDSASCWNVPAMLGEVICHDLPT
jgi:hypothetical protein